ncbi:hypothetical protein [Paenibacillus alvei]|uniref:hypothetical protein n=1 Tax=Paenibacillus alvei TaxID=44250 RepID=UPI0013DB6570|nr:hypothetical protein [Paenibacillus alvei]
MNTVRSSFTLTDRVHHTEALKQASHSLNLQRFCAFQQGFSVISTRPIHTRLLRADL